MHLPAQIASRHTRVGAVAALSILAGIYWGTSATAEIDPERFKPRAPAQRYLLSAPQPPSYGYPAHDHATAGYAIRLAYVYRPEPVREWAPEERPYYGQGYPDGGGYADPVRNVADESDLGVVNAPGTEGVDCLDCGPAPAAEPVSEEPAPDQACGDDCSGAPSARNGESMAIQRDRDI